MNVTVTAFVPAVDAPKTKTRLVAVDNVHDVIAPLTIVAAQSPPCAEVMKLAPVTVMELLW